MLFKKLAVLILPIIALSSCTVVSEESSDPQTTITYADSMTDAELAPFKNSPVNIKFWNPISGPDSGNLQNLIKYWNNTYGDYISISNDSLAEGDHYTRLYTSFSDNSTADLTLIHSSTIPVFERANKLRPMNEMLAKVGINSSQYLESIWNSTIYNNNIYGLAWDILPTVCFYNRHLIPEGYTEEMIHDENFTIADMQEMMKQVYVHHPSLSKRTFGMSFNYAFTENPFTSFLYQLGGQIVDSSNPKNPVFNSQAGVDAATAFVGIPFTKNDAGYKVSSESGSNHLTVFSQGRALFTIDGLWSTNSLVLDNEDVDTGVALLPKATADGERSTYGDSHVFATFKNKNQSAHKDDAMGLVIRFLAENSLEWCKGGKVAVRNDDINDPEYIKLPWAFISQKLDKIVPPEQVYTYSTIKGTLGEYISKLCEGTLTNVKAALDQCASDARDLANNIQ